MLIAFWFRTSRGLGYGVTAPTKEIAVRLLGRHGFPEPGVEIIEVIAGIRFADLDPAHVVPNAGPMRIQGVWFPRLNL
ncbi:hypothetical protein [Pseudoxanthomonas beigongshangi]